MEILKNVRAADMSSLGVGGVIEHLVRAENADELVQLIEDSNTPRPIVVLGSATNVVVSDKGLSGTVVTVDIKDMTREGDDITVGAGVSWDDFVQYAIAEKLWGVELTSGIPGSIGAGVFGNIAAYGQAVADTLRWVEVVDSNAEHPTVMRLHADQLDLKYRYSNFQEPENNHFIIVRANLGLSQVPTGQLEYNKAKIIAEEKGWDIDTLDGRRKTIMEARRQAGSLLDHAHRDKTAGSFFKNPVVESEKIDQLLAYDESGAQTAILKRQNEIHGGSAQRVSAALVLLAAGYKRGQTWGNVRLHPDHVLKIENAGAATAQEIYDVVQEIIQTVKQKLNITLEPEVRFIGDY